MPVLSWLDDETKQLENLFHAGLSFSLIAKNITTKSKNACVSKAKRIGLPRRARVIACERTPRAPVKHSPCPRVPKPETAETPKPVLPVDSRDWRCTIIQLKDRSCRYPLWDAPEDERLYCGRPTARLSEGKPYCATHARIAFHTRT